MEIRQGQRVLSCKACNKTIKPKTELIIHFHSHLNRGTTVHMCRSCVEEAHKLMEANPEPTE